MFKIKKRWGSHKRAAASVLVYLILRLCGEYSETLTETSKSNKMSVTFYSDNSYVDRGFSAEFEAIDVKDRK